MTILQIYVAPHPILKKKAEPVTEGITDDLRKIMDDMLETMYATDGIGLAAPQIGVSKRIIVMDIEQPKNPLELPPEERRGNPTCFINPEILSVSEEMRTYNEGCLSVPGQYADIERPEKIRFKYMDYDGKEHEVDADGILATCIQHEIDHLDGILFIDHLSSLKRSMVMRKLKKFTREHEEKMAETHVIL